MNLLWNFWNCYWLWSLNLSFSTDFFLHSQAHGLYWIAFLAYIKHRTLTSMLLAIVLAGGPKWALACSGSYVCHCHVSDSIWNQLLAWSPAPLLDAKPCRLDWVFSKHQQLDQSVYHLSGAHKWKDWLSGPGPSSVLLSSCSLVPSINWVTPGCTPRYNPEVGMKLCLFHRRWLCDQPFFTYTCVTLSNIPTSHNNNIIQNNSSLTPTHYHRFLLSSHSFLSFCFIFILKLFPDPIVIM